VSVSVAGLCTDTRSVQCVCNRTVHRHTQRAVCQNVQCDLSLNKFILLVFGLSKLTENAVVWYTGVLKRCTAFIAFDWIFTKF